MPVDVPEPLERLDAILASSPGERPDALIGLGRELLEAGDHPEARQRLAAALAALIEEGIGDRRERLEMGEVLGWLGDPRLRLPTDPDYWVEVALDDGVLNIGCFPVTTAEFRRFIESGGYDDPAHWSDEGWAWRQSCPDPWPVKAEGPDAGPFVVPNQPVVGVCWFEAQAYARWAGGRLPRFDERVRVMRGDEKRCYPWGSPFSEGSANTREEVLGRPCAVGLYLRDATPEGVRDLAGNVAEWNLDGVGDHDRWVHPGAWHQPSMASWAKARELEAPTRRSGGLGFRLVRG